ncbi:MAG: type II secretion system protein [Minisyncoccia bacterium]
MPKKTIKKESGYTIIETMIAVSLFVIIVMLGMGALLNANLLHKKSQGMRSIMDNLSFVMEDISRSLRTGYNYHCLVANQASLPQPFTARSCEDGVVGIAFEAENGDPDDNTDQWVYYVENGIIKKSTDGATIFPLTPAEVEVEKFSFSILGAEPPPGNTQQPLIFIKISGKITLKDNATTPFYLQTAVSQRAVDI